jgi:hypothetical protein
MSGNPLWIPHALEPDDSDALGNPDDDERAERCVDRHVGWTGECDFRTERPLLSRRLLSAEDRRCADDRADDRQPPGRE